MVYLQPFWCNSFLKCVSQPEIAKNSLKPPYFGGSRSFKVIDVDISKKLVASVCYVNRFIKSKKLYSNKFINYDKNVCIPTFRLPPEVFVLFSSTLTRSQCDAGNITFCDFCCFRCASFLILLLTSV